MRKLKKEAREKITGLMYTPPALDACVLPLLGEN